MKVKHVMQKIDNAQFLQQSLQTALHATKDEIGTANLDYETVSLLNELIDEYVWMLESIEVKRDKEDILQ